MDGEGEGAELAGPENDGSGEMKDQIIFQPSVNISRRV